MLPDGFQWTDRYQNCPAGELALKCGAMQAADLLQKCDGSWYAILRPYQETFAPYVMRDCATRESGIAGVVAWARRHEAHLREQAAMYEARLPRHSAVPPRVGIS